MHSQILEFIELCIDLRIKKGFFNPLMEILNQLYKYNQLFNLCG